jgi:hypothetical protein
MTAPERPSVGRWCVSSCVRMCVRPVLRHPPCVYVSCGGGGGWAVQEAAASTAAVEIELRRKMGACFGQTDGEPPPKPLDKPKPVDKPVTSF